ncbi:metallophosphoesterase [Sinomonas sp. ASV322]|uniref:metallophosphoesterase family protein n=1 Tax=Sinomonas sp. ASV322 TaxID=3041920 RepID=UPI0027DD92D5|nr:metallophosphoesterase [Sinomonas sp. ASV322]MDQ4501477.1 metallophosphoesterase [Sinomonas sp. ASV322]
MKIVQISDTHLGATVGSTTEAVRKVISYIDDVLKPDFVVHTGDVQVIDPDNAADRDHAQAVLSGLKTPYRVLPGNHDIGEPAEHAWNGQNITAERVEAFTSVFGPAQWRVDLDGAVLLGLNSELFGSGIDEEAAQWAWIEQTVAEIGPETPVMLFQHKPIWTVIENSDHNLDIRESATRLLELLGKINLKSVGTGHLHCFRTEQRGEILEVWAPATAFMAGTDEMAFGKPVTHQLGIVSYTLSDAGVTAELLRVPGLEDALMLEMADVKAVVEELMARA